MDAIQPCGKNITLLHIKSVDCVTRHHTVSYSWTIRSTAINRLRWWVPQEKQDILFILQPSVKVHIGEIIVLKMLSLRQQRNNTDIHASRKGDNIAAFQHHKTTQEYLLPQSSQRTRQNDKAHNIELHINNFKEDLRGCMPIHDSRFWFIK